MTVIENEYLKVAIDLKGAQLSSFFNKQTNTEHLWQADPNVWPWHAPNLFPVVGGLINNQLLVNGEAYEMGRHGFARQSEFILLEADEVSASFSLPHCEKTLQVYPYKFDFQVLYTLIDNSLRITYKVINLDKKTIYFSVGGHPAFNVPFNKGEKYEDYYLEFETDEHLEAQMLSSGGFFTGETHPVLTPGNKLYLTRQLFDADALVFKQLNSRMVSIKSNKHDQSLSIEFPHFNYLGLWAKPGADFVCIEPWLGCADTEGHQVNIDKKEAIQSLHAGHVFEAPYFVSV
ncbi:aldose 1-epimerase family protein [Mucilaginibacter sabulilitoris]|uniref:Aldose 1-epimerase family protein n=1 Tax=Mucilaginibacter sabulilitoris TaxID=1173583 RepID=A0ABZ0TK18_9SPHI|nr:aldose 1-epimerase family protein [Mucilaginibacter sabulilitoris]WPU93388.1 aldose 1-epimerase family protein [Mucilaginibacter sabulilitoris]